MSQFQDIDRGSTLLKITSAAFIIGAVLLIIFNLLSPRPDDPANVQSVLKAMSSQRVLTLLSQLMLTAGRTFMKLGAMPR